MKPPRSRHSSAGPDASAAAARDLDALYGLEPVFEPNRGHDETLGIRADFHGIQCPYCGERFDTLLDASSGAATYIEDCQICCQPIELELQVDSGGVLAGVSVRRC